LAVWYQGDGFRPNIWANRDDSGNGWGSAEHIEIEDRYAFSPQIAIDNNGNALAVWLQDDGSRYNIWANRYTLSSGWGLAKQIEGNNIGSAYDPQISFDNNGNALTVWQQENGSLHNIWANRYTLSSGWGSAEKIESNDIGSAYDPQISINNKGSALAVWIQNNGSKNNIWSNRFE
jgi:uncharacterized protein YbdZ (MbtH family)